MSIPGGLLSQLSEVLAELYYDQGRLQTMATTAGLSLAHIPAYPRPLDYWAEVLKEAEVKGCTQVILDQARSEKPVYGPLQLARQAYADWVAAGRPPIPAPVQQPRIFISHATAGTPDAPVFRVLAELLVQQGFTVWAKADNARAIEPWSTRLLKELGTCDGAVVLLNQAVLDDSDNWVYDDLRLLRWRSWLEADAGFGLVVLCLDAPCEIAFQGELWELLEIDTVPQLQYGSDDALRAQLQMYLQPLESVRRRDWRLADLQAAMQRLMHATQIAPLRLRQAAEDLAPQASPRMSVPQVEGVDWAHWWCHTLLCGGPSLLRCLAENLGPLLSGEARIGLRELVAPTWVDLRAAGLIPRLGLHPRVRRRAFYVNGSMGNNKPVVDPRFIAEMYLRRACWGEAGALCWPLAVVPPKAASHAEALQRVRTQLEQIFGIDAAVAEEGWTDEVVAEIDPWEEIRLRVEENLQAHRPTILLLSGLKINDTALQTELRDKCGPVTFFFIFVEPETARAVGVLPLQPAITDEADRRAYNDWRTLGGTLTLS